MRRQLALLEHALGAMRRRAGRNLAIAAGLALVVGLFASTMFLAEAMRAAHRALARDAPVLTVQRIVAGRPATIDAHALDGLGDAVLARVSVTPRVWGYAFVGALEGNVTISSIAEGSAGEAISRGALPSADGEAAVGPGIARSLGLRVGDELTLPTPALGAAGDLPPVLALRIVGILDVSSAPLTNDLVLVRDADARALLGIAEGEAADLAVDVAPVEEAPVVAAEIARRLPAVRVIDRALVARTYELTFDARAGFVGAMLLPALAALLLLGWERLTGLGDSERREIGVLKAVGWSTADVLAARVWESGLVAIFGAVGGVLFAYAYVFLMGAPGLAHALLGWSNLRPALELPPAIDGGMIAAIVGGVVVPFVGVSIVPAWRAAMLDPDRLLRGQA